MMMMMMTVGRRSSSSCDDRLYEDRGNRKYFGRVIESARLDWNRNAVTGEMAVNCQSGVREWTGRNCRMLLLC
jgi:hypothetical protein